MKQKILVSRLSAIGDVVRTIPAVKGIRNVFPESEIHWLVEDRCASILEGLAYVDALKIVPRRKWEKLTFLKKIHAYKRFVGELKQERYDIYLDFHGLFKSGIYGFLAGIPRRIGYPGGIAKEFSRLLTNEKVSTPPGRMSRYTRNFLIPKHFDSRLFQEPADLPLSRENRLFAARYLSSQGLPEKRYVFIYPGTSARGRFKRWMPEAYGALADRFVDNYSLPSVIGWGPGEEEMVTLLRKNTAHPVFVLPSTSLKQQAAVIEKALIFIGGDTGAVHMASMAGTPGVVILGPSDPVTNEPAPFTPFRIVTARLHCSPCRNRECPTLDCLQAVTTDMVMQSASDLLSEIGFQ